MYATQHHRKQNHMKVQAAAEAAQAVAEAVLVAAEAAVNSAKTISKKTIIEWKKLIHQEPGE